MAVSRFAAEFIYSDEAFIAFCTCKKMSSASVRPMITVLVTAYIL